MRLYRLPYLLTKAEIRCIIYKVNYIYLKNILRAGIIMSENNIKIENGISARCGKWRKWIIIAALAVIVAAAVTVTLILTLGKKPAIPPEREIFYSDGFEFVYKTEDTLSIVSYRGDEEEVHIPSTLVGLAVTEVAEDAFLGNIYIRNLSFGMFLTDIAPSAFRGCSELQTVTLPKSIKKLKWKLCSTRPN